MAKVEFQVLNVRFDIPTQQYGFNHAWFRTAQEVQELKGKVFIFGGAPWRVEEVSQLTPGFYFAKCESFGPVVELKIEFVLAPALGGAH